MVAILNPTPDCLTTEQLAVRWGKSRDTIFRMNADTRHPLKCASFSRRPLMFPMRLVRGIEEGLVRPISP